MHDKTLILPIHEHLQLHASQYKQKTQLSSHPLHKLQHSIAKKTLSSTTAATQQHSHRPPLSLQQTLKQTCSIYIHILSSRHIASRGTEKYYTQLHHPLAALKRYFPASLLPISEQINHHSSNHTYTKSTTNHIHRHCATSVTATHTTHIISSTAPTYAPRRHSWICGQTPME